MDIFDAGPTLQVPLSDIRTVRESRRATVTAVAKELDASVLFPFDRAISK